MGAVEQRVGRHGLRNAGEAMKPWTPSRLRVLELRIRKIVERRLERGEMALNNGSFYRAAGPRTPDDGLPADFRTDCGCLLSALSYPEHGVTRPPSTLGISWEEWKQLERGYGGWPQSTQSETPFTAIGARIRADYYEGAES